MHKHSQPLPKCSLCPKAAKSKCLTCSFLFCHLHSSHNSPSHPLSLILFNLPITHPKTLQSLKSLLETQQNLILESHIYNYITYLLITHNNNYLISGGEDWSVRLWKFPECSQIKILDSHDAPVSCMCLSCNDSILISGSADGSIKVFDLLSKNCSFELFGHKNEVSSVSVSESCKFCVSGSLDNVCRVWDLVERVQKFSLASGFSMKFVRIVRKDLKLVSNGETSQVVVWDLERKMKEFVIGDEKFPKEHVSCMELDTQQRVLATGLLNGLICLVDLHNFTEIGTLKGHSASVQSLIISNSCKFLFSSDNTEKILIWDLQLMQLTYIWSCGEVPNTLYIDKNDEFLIISNQKVEITLWSIQHTERIKHVHGHNSFVYCCWICDNFKDLFAIDDLNKLALWDMKKKEMVKVVEIGEKIKCFAVDRSAMVVGFVGLDNGISIWEVGKEKSCKKNHAAEGVLEKIRFSMSSRYLLVQIWSHDSRKIQVWTV